MSESDMNEKLYSELLYILSEDFSEERMAYVIKLADTFINQEPEKRPSLTPSQISEIESKLASSIDHIDHYHVVSNNIAGIVLLCGKAKTYTPKYQIDNIYHTVGTARPELANLVEYRSEILRLSGIIEEDETVLTEEMGYIHRGNRLSTQFIRQLMDKIRS